MPQKTGLRDDFELFAASAVSKVSKASQALLQSFRPKASVAAQQQRTLRDTERATMHTVKEEAESPELQDNRASGMLGE